MVTFSWATYWREKKSISLTRNDISEFGVAKVPQNLKEYKKLIFISSKKNKNHKLRALKYMKFFLNAGSNIKYFKGSYETGYRFKNLDLDYNITAKTFYLMGS